MKSLNNKGWGLNTMIILVVVLIFVVLLVSILVYNIGRDDDSPNSLFNNHELSMSLVI